MDDEAKKQELRALFLQEVASIDYALQADVTAMRENAPLGGVFRLHVNGLPSVVTGFLMSAARIFQALDVPGNPDAAYAILYGSIAALHAARKAVEEKTGPIDLGEREHLFSKEMREAFLTLTFKILTNRKAAVFAVNSEDPKDPTKRRQVRASHTLSATPVDGCFCSLCAEARRKGS